MKKALTAIFLIFTLVASGADVYGAGLKINDDGTSEVIEDNMISEETEIYYKPSDNTDVIRPYNIMPFADVSGDHGYFYDQLNEIDKYIYDEIDKNIDLLLDGTINRIEINISDSYTIYTTDNYDFLKAPIAYVRYDHTEDFWLDPTIRCSMNYYTSSGKIANICYYFGDYSNGVASTYAPPYENSNMAMEETERVGNRTNEIIDIPENATRYKKLQIINDWLVDNNAYNPYVAAGDEESYNKANEVAWMLTSALLYGNGEDTAMYPVCEGYAEAFKLLCDSMDIPCVIVKSNTHEWNAVQMDDGKWYYADVTFNDPIISGGDEDWIKETIELYRYRHFLVGTDNRYINDADHIVSMEKDLNLPDVSENDYVYSNTGDADMDGYLTEADAALMLKDISGISKITDEQAVSGDIDGDGEITLVDVTKLLEKIG